MVGAIILPKKKRKTPHLLYCLHYATLAPPTRRAVFYSRDHVRTTWHERETARCPPTQQREPPPAPQSTRSTARLAIKSHGPSASTTARSRSRQDSFTFGRQGDTSTPAVSVERPKTMADAGSSAAARRAPSSSSPGGCAPALGRLVRKLRRQSRLLCAATGGARHAAAASSSARCRHHHHQYDPLSYARNFDFGTALEGNEAHCSFASRFVLAAPAARQAQ